MPTRYFTFGFKSKPLRNVQKMDLQKYSEFKTIETNNTFVVICSKTKWTLVEVCVKTKNCISLACLNQIYNSFVWENSF